MSELNETCEGCRFWDSSRDPGFRGEGKCRRYAPVREHWPITDSSDWCGEFEPIEEQRPDEDLEGDAAMRHVRQAEDEDAL